MSHRWRYDRREKLEAPSDGHSVKRELAASWWAKLWISALEQVLDGNAGRLQRGRAYARTGRVSSVDVSGNVISARVTGTRRYAVTIHVSPLSASEWTRALTAMAEQAQYTASLLGGQIPIQTAELFRSLGVALLPTTSAELQTTCTCPDWEEPCKHVAAVHYVLADALDMDPFLLFELRGRDKKSVLDAMNHTRSMATHRLPDKVSESLRRSKRKQPETITNDSTAWQAHEYDRLPAALPALQFSFGFESDKPNDIENVVPALAQLGVPLGWAEGQSPLETFSPMIRATAAFARAIATADDEQMTTLLESPGGKSNANVDAKVGRRRNANAMTTTRR